jgi:PAS domain-containing protein
MDKVPTGTPSSRTLPDTYFAPPERATEEELRLAVRAVADSPMVGTLVQAFGSMVAVLDRHRQILAVNDGLLRFLGVADAPS